jgi:hypothetical protein
LPNIFSRNSKTYYESEKSFDSGGDLLAFLVLPMAKRVLQEKNG